MSRPLITEFESMICAIVSDVPPKDCFQCEFYFSLPPPDNGFLGCCIKKNVHVDGRQIPCEWRKISGPRTLADEAERLVPMWLEGIKRWCMGEGYSIEQCARRSYERKASIDLPGGGETDEDYLKREVS